MSALFGKGCRGDDRDTTQAKCVNLTGEGHNVSIIICGEWEFEEAGRCACMAESDLPLPGRVRGSFPWDNAVNLYGI